MSIQHTITRSYKDQSTNTIICAESPTGTKEVNYDDSIAVSANHQVKIDVTRSALQSLAISSDVDVTLFTNNPSGSSPTDTIPIVGGQAKVWTLAKDGLSLCPFTASVTTAYVTNASGGPANFKFRALLNE